MFSGIIDHCGSVRKIVTKDDSLVLEISTTFEDLTDGESIAVDGVCLTAVKAQDGAFSCDVSSETLKVTRAGSYQAGQAVNLERALRLGERLGGHLVTGHVDQPAQVSNRRGARDFLGLEFTGILDANRRYILQKGSVAVQGVSLTVHEVFKDGFYCLLVPHTLERTNLKELRSGDIANIEFDWMAKIIVKQWEEFPGMVGRGLGSWGKET